MPRIPRGNLLEVRCRSLDVLALGLTRGRLDLPELAVLAIPVIVGILILIFVVRVILWLLPAGIVAAIAWFLTWSALLTGIAFLAVVLIGLLRR